MTYPHPMDDITGFGPMNRERNMDHESKAMEESAIGHRSPVSVQELVAELKIALEFGGIYASYAGPEFLAQFSQVTRGARAAIRKAEGAHMQNDGTHVDPDGEPGS